MALQPPLQRFLDNLRRQPPLVLASYLCALIGTRMAVFEFHHFRPTHLGRSTPLLGLAIVLYVLGRGSRRR